MLQEGKPSWSALTDKTREISGLQGKLELEVVQFCLKFRGSLQAEQKIAFMDFMKQHLLTGRSGQHRGRGPRGPWGRFGRGLYGGN